MISFLTSHWEVIVSIIVLVVLGLVYIVPQIITFIGYPTEKKMSIIKKFLLQLVTEAESKFDDGDFDLIFNYVYSAFVARFPFEVKWFTEDKLKELVKNAITELKEILAKSGKTVASLKNPNINPTMQITSNVK